MTWCLSSGSSLPRPQHSEACLCIVEYRSNNKAKGQDDDEWMILMEHQVNQTDLHQNDKTYESEIDRLNGEQTDK